MVLRVFIRILFFHKIFQGCLYGGHRFEQTIVFISNRKKNSPTTSDCSGTEYPIDSAVGEFRILLDYCLFHMFIFEPTAPGVRLSLGCRCSNILKRQSLFVFYRYYRENHFMFNASKTATYRFRSSEGRDAIFFFLIRVPKHAVCKAKIKCRSIYITV